MTPSVNGASRVRPGARRPALAVLALGLLVLAAAVAVACRSTPPEDTGASRASALASASPAAPSGPAVPVTEGALPSAAGTVPPTRLRIASIGVTATVNPVAVNASTNEFEVPPSVDEVGWYRYGPGLDATAGSMVIAGHVDGATQGAGAFFKLRDLPIGAPVEVTGADGRSRTFRVVARETYPKAGIPLGRFFARDGAPRLTLITCGGPFDRTSRHYRDNVVVTAAPA